MEPNNMLHTSMQISLLWRLEFNNVGKYLGESTYKCIFLISVLFILKNDLGLRISLLESLIVVIS